MPKKLFSKNFFIILFLMIIGLLMRTYYLHQNNILFGYDQARDAYIASEIAQGDLKILGPPVSIGGFYHGVFYYYFIALPYYLSHGNPILPIIFICTNHLAVVMFSIHAHNMARCNLHHTTCSSYRYKATLYVGICQD